MANGGNRHATYPLRMAHADSERRRPTLNHDRNDDTPMTSIPPPSPPLPTADQVTARSIAGTLSLRFSAAGGRTRLAEAKRPSGQQVQRLLYLDPLLPDLATCLLLNPTAGLFAGDRLDLHVTAESGARVCVGSAVPTRVFNMPEGRAALHQHFTVAPDGYLEVRPEPLLLCGDAVLSVVTEVEAAEGATVLLAEPVLFGRPAAGERWVFRDFTSSATITYGARTILCDATSIQPAADADQLRFLSGYSAGLTMYVVGPGATALLPFVRDHLAAASQVWGGASLLSKESGLTLRALASGAEPIRKLADAVAHTVRSRLVGGAGG